MGSKISKTKKNSVSVANSANEVNNTLENSVASDMSSENSNRNVKNHTSDANKSNSLNIEHDYNNNTMKDMSNNKLDYSVVSQQHLYGNNHQFNKITSPLFNEESSKSLGDLNSYEERAQPNKVENKTVVIVKPLIPILVNSANNANRINNNANSYATLRSKSVLALNRRHMNSKDSTTSSENLEDDAALKKAKGVRFAEQVLVINDAEFNESTEDAAATSSKYNFFNESASRLSYFFSGNKSGQSASKNKANKENEKSSTRNNTIKHPSSAPSTLSTNGTNNKEENINGQIKTSLNVFNKNNTQMKLKI